MGGNNDMGRGAQDGPTTVHSLISNNALPRAAPAIVEEFIKLFRKARFLFPLSSFLFSLMLIIIGWCIFVFELIARKYKVFCLFLSLKKSCKR